MGPSEVVRLEAKIDKLLTLVGELVKSQSNIEIAQDEIVEKLNNLNVSGDGFTVYGSDT